MFKCFHGSSATAYLNRVPCSLQMRAIGFNTIPILCLFVIEVKQFLSNLLLNQGVGWKGKTTGGLCHNQEAVIVMIIEAPDVFCQVTNDGWEDLKEDDPSLSLSDHWL